MRSERMGKGAVVTRESCKLAEGADEGGVVSSQSSRELDSDAEPSSWSRGCVGMWGGTEHVVNVRRGLLSPGMVGSGRSSWWRHSTRGTLDMGHLAQRRVGRDPV